MQYADQQLNIGFWANGSTEGYDQATYQPHASAMYPQAQQWAETDFRTGSAHQLPPTYGARKLNAARAEAPRRSVGQITPRAAIDRPLHVKATGASRRRGPQQLPTPTSTTHASPQSYQTPQYGVNPSNPVAKPSTTAHNTRPKKSSPPTKPQSPETERKLAGTLVDYDSLLFRKPEIVESWRNLPFGYTDEHIMYILQLFEQISQIKSQARVDNILQTRQSHIIQQGQWDLLDTLDPLRLCPPEEGRPQGVPRFGSILNGAPYKETNEPIEGNRPVIDYSKTDVKMKKGEKGYQLRPYRPNWQCLPIGATCWDILKYHPNHLAYEFLDAFLQHRMTDEVTCNVWLARQKLPGDIWRALDDSIKPKFYQQDLVKTDQDGNVFKKRMDKRVLVLLEKAGKDCARVEAYLKSPIKIRALGGNLQGTDEVTCNVWLARQKNDAAWQRWNAYQAELGQEEQENNLRDSSSDPSFMFTPTTSTTTRTTPTFSSSPSVAYLGKQPAARHPNLSRHLPSAPAAVVAMNAVPVPRAHKTETSSNDPQPTSVTTLNSEIQFSASVSDHGLGQFQGTQFWSSKREYTQHVQQILSLHNTSRRLRSWIVEHDAKSSTFDHAKNMELRNVALVCLFCGQAERIYRTAEPPVQLPASRSLDVDAIMAQIELDVATLLQQKLYMNVQNLSYGEVQSLKNGVLAQQVSFHKTITQPLATVVSNILLGAREGVVSIAEDPTILDAARSLVAESETAIEAQCLKHSSCVQRFHYSDELKNAIASDIVEDARRAAGTDRDDVSFLLAMQEEAKTAKETMISTFIGNDRPTIPLSAALENTAEYLFDEILEQIEEELNKLRGAKSIDKTGSRKHRRLDEDEDDDFAEDQDSQPTKKPRMTLEDPSKQQNGPKALQPRQPPAIDPQQKRQQLQNFAPEQHQNAVAEPAEVAPLSERPPEHSNEMQAFQDSRYVSRPNSIPTGIEVAAPQADDPPAIAPTIQETLAQDPHNAEHEGRSTSHVHFNEDVASYLDEPVDFGEMPEEFMHSRIPVSEPAVVPAYPPQPNARKRQRAMMRKTSRPMHHWRSRHD